MPSVELHGHSQISAAESSEHQEQVKMSSDISSVAITGGTGLVGTALTDLLSSRGMSVAAISRSAGGAYQDAIHWDPEKGLTNPSRLESVDAVVHLAGENIAAGRWNSTLKTKIRNSRVHGTRNLIQSMAVIENRPKVLVCASATGFYGDRGHEKLTESSDPGEGFLPEVCQAWEAETDAARELGIRVVNLRIGVVLTPKGGALKSMLLPFKMGVGGVIGSGRQHMSWIGLHDLIRVITHCIENENVEGPVNAVSPEPVTNAEFTKTLGRVLGRPTVLPLPGFAAKLALGEMADALLLASTRVLPEQLRKQSFEFAHADLESCLRHELGR